MCLCKNGSCFISREFQKARKAKRAFNYFKR
jgi:hypothetical protein